MANKLFRILDAAGRALCFQVARDSKEAVDFAKMYGHRRAHSAEYVREA